MLFNFLLLADVLIYAFIISQHLFYLMAMTSAQKQSGAASYIELRHSLDKQLNTTLRMTYYAGLLISLIVLVVACLQGSGFLIITAMIAFIGLIADVFIAGKFNIPLNRMIDKWQSHQYPAEWQKVRSKWFYYFSIRQVFAITGFICLMIGLVFK